jgi:uncharacterized glyoxalase superfamily protein PhnB
MTRKVLKVASSSCVSLAEAIDSTHSSGEIMSSRLNPYLTFNGNARQAMEFYASVFGGILVLNTWGEFGATDAPDVDRIGHARLETDAGYTIMAGDVTSDMQYRPMAGCSVSPQRRRRRPPARLLGKAVHGRERHDAHAEAGLGRRVRHVR